MNQLGAEEVWKPILGYEGRYEVSSEGNIRSVPRRAYGGVNNKTWRDIPQKEIYQHEATRKTVPYRQVCLWIGTKGKTFKVHRLVLEAFVGRCPVGMQACHNDGNSLNNKLGNLRWGTAAENVADIARHGRRMIGSANHKAKLSEDQVIAIRRSLDTPSQIAKQYGVSEGNVRQILKGDSWKHLLS